MEGSMLLILLMEAHMVMSILMFAVAMCVSMIYLFKSLTEFQKTKVEVNGFSLTELEAIRRHLPSIIRVIEQREKIGWDNQKVILNKASADINYAFRSKTIIERLATYTIALIDERYELLNEYQKVVDQDFLNNVPVMNDIIRCFYRKP